MTQLLRSKHCAALRCDTYNKRRLSASL